MRPAGGKSAQLGAGYMVRIFIREQAPSGKQQGQNNI